MLSIAAPFNKDAAIPAGEVTVRDVAGLYIFDNTLLGVTLTGAQVKDYLETSATYFQKVSGTGPFPASALTNAVTPTAPNGTPDYNYDIMGGLDARLTYDIDLANDAGSRISNLQYAGAADGCRRLRSSSRSTTTGRAVAATSRTSRPRRWSTTARWRSAS